MYGLQHKIVVITGAAKGIGLAATEAFAVEGAVVIVTDIDNDILEASLQPLLAKGLRIEAHQQDVVDELRWESLVEDVTARHGGIDILVNNAGIGILSNVETSTFEEWRRVMAVTLAAGVLSKIPMKRMAKPREIAPPMLFLASEDASYMTGSELIVDGGYLAA
tara:strand:+ start:609 stop:1100 length:492 start_codon:yes stop_codon:yes gene_type:complete